MSCDATREALGAYADGQAASDERGRIEGHLEGCAGCREALAEVRSLKASVALLVRPSLPPELKAELLAQARRLEAGEAPARRLPLAWAGGFSLAFAAAFLMMLAPRPASDVVPLDEMLAAHARYAQSVTAAADADGSLWDETDDAGEEDDDDLGI